MQFVSCNFRNVITGMTRIFQQMFRNFMLCWCVVLVFLAWWWSALRASITTERQSIVSCTNSISDCKLMGKCAVQMELFIYFDTKNCKSMMDSLSERVSYLKMNNMSMLILKQHCFSSRTLKDSIAHVKIKLETKCCGETKCNSDSWQMFNPEL